MKNKPFNSAEWQREYCARPEVKERRKLRNSKEEVILKNKISQKKYAEKNKDKIENSRLLRQFNITLNQYNSMFESQNGCCAICKVHQLELKTKLHVDHCHITNVVRGLLCYNCNRALGLFKDSEESLSNALQYIKDANGIKEKRYV